MTSSGTASVWRCHLLWLPLAVTVVLVVAGYYPTRRLAGDEGVRAMILAQGLVLAVVYGTLAPAMKRMTVLEPARHLQVGLKVGTTRLVATAILAGSGVWLKWAEPRVFLLWAAIAYGVMISIETVVLLWWSRRIEKRA